MYSTLRESTTTNVIIGKGRNIDSGDEEPHTKRGQLEKATASRPASEASPPLSSRRAFSSLDDGRPHLLHPSPSLLLTRQRTQKSRACTWMNRPNVRLTILGIRGCGSWKACRQRDGETGLKTARSVVRRPFRMRRCLRSRHNPTCTHADAVFSPPSRCKNPLERLSVRGCVHTYAYIRVCINEANSAICRSPLSRLHHRPHCRSPLTRAIHAVCNCRPVKTDCTDASGNRTRAWDAR